VLSKTGENPPSTEPALSGSATKTAGQAADSPIFSSSATNSCPDNHFNGRSFIATPLFAEPLFQQETTTDSNSTAEDRASSQGICMKNHLTPNILSR
jgi:hypothetical protein